METALAKQSIQEFEYYFPYHYISEFRGGFNQTFNWTWGLYHASSVEFLINRIKDFKFNSVIDIGCGDGRFVRELFIEFPGRKILGVDYSEKAISLARAMNPMVRFEQMDITKTRLEETADLITLVEVLEHIPPDQVRDFIKAAANLLHQDGKMILTVPHINKSLEEKHFQHFNISMLEKAVSGIFRIDEVVYFEKVAIVAKVMNKILTNPLFILNQRQLKNLLYRIYKFWLFPANERNASRMYVVLSKVKNHN